MKWTLIKIVFKVVCEESHTHSEICDCIFLFCHLPSLSLAKTQPLQHQACPLPAFLMEKRQDSHLSWLILEQLPLLQARQRIVSLRAANHRQERGEGKRTPSLTSLVVFLLPQLLLGRPSCSTPPLHKVSCKMREGGSVR